MEEVWAGLAGLLSILVIGLVALVYSMNMFSGLAGESMSAHTTARKTTGISGSTAQAPSRTQPQQRPARMQFKNYGTNVFTPTVRKAVSTFSLDVDTGSYTISNAYLRDGNIPPRDAVRPEEFINYFDYGHPQRTSPVHTGLRATESPFHNTTYLTAYTSVTRDIPRPPAHITLVIDTSGSMSGEGRLGLLKESVKQLLNALREGDTVSIVSYETRATRELEATAATQTDRIIDVIDSLRPGGSTNAEEGLTEGYSMAEQHNKPINRVILLSDGVANVGRTGPDSIYENIKEYTEQGITLTTVGIGMGNYNDELLEQLADTADGNYYYINQPAEARRVFVDELQKTLQVVASQVKAQLRFNPETVESHRLIGYENRKLNASQFTTGDGAELGPGQEATALYELRRTGNRGQIANYTLRYTIDGETRTKTERITTDTIRTYDEAQTHVQEPIIVARFAQTLRRTAPPTGFDQLYGLAEQTGVQDDIMTALDQARPLIQRKVTR